MRLQAQHSNPVQSNPSNQTHKLAQRNLLTWNQTRLKRTQSSRFLSYCTHGQPLWLGLLTHVKSSDNKSTGWMITINSRSVLSDDDIDKCHDTLDVKRRDRDSSRLWALLQRGARRSGGSLFHTAASCVVRRATSWALRRAEVIKSGDQIK